MRFSMFKGEKTLSELVQRMFRIKGRGSKAAAKEVEASLLQVNPHLKELGSVPFGSAIHVPEMDHPVNEGELMDLSGFLQARELERMRNGLEVMRQSLSASADQAVAQEDATLALLKKPEVQAAAANNPALMKLLDGIRKRVQQNLRDIEAIKASNEKEITQIQKLFAAFPQG